MSKTVEILEHLVAFNTVSSQPNLSIVHYIDDFLKQRGFVTTIIPDETETKAGIYASIGPSGRGIMLSAHTDVVPIEGQKWTKDPFKLTT